MTKLTAKESIDDILDASCPWLDGATREAIATKLAKDGFTIIPTDPASVEAMVERGAMVLALVNRDVFGGSRAVLTAAIPGLTGADPVVDKRQEARPDSYRQPDRQ